MTALSMFVVTVFKHRTRAIISLVVFIMLFQLILPMFKPLLMYSGQYESYYVYLYDINYHFGIMYYSIINLFSNVKFSPLAQMRISDFIGIFSIVVEGNNEDQDLGFMPDRYTTLQYISPIIIFTFWIVLSSLLMVLSYRILKKQDID